MKNTQFKRTPAGVKTPRMLEVEAKIGAKLEDDYNTHYLNGTLGQKRLAARWGVKRSQIFGQLRGGRRNWCEMLDLPPKGNAVSKKQTRDGACETCDDNNVPLERAHWIPASEGGSTRADNILKLCPNCHTLLDRGDVVVTERAREVILLRAVENLLRSRPQRDEAMQRELLVQCRSMIECRSSTPSSVTADALPNPSLQRSTARIGLSAAPSE